MPDWLCDLVTSEPFYLVVGALLAGVVGLASTWLHDRLKVHATRKALGGLLETELEAMDFGDSPLISDDPPTARQLALNALPLLLAPGVFDTKTDRDLLRELVWLSSTVDDFNDRARTYNAAWASSAPRQMQQLCFNDLQMSYHDYKEARSNMMAMVGRLSEPAWWERLWQRIRNQIPRETQRPANGHAPAAAPRDTAPQQESQPVPPQQDQS